MILDIFYFMAGMIIYQLLKPDISQARVDNGCLAPETPGDMAVCLIFDAIIPYMIIGVLATAAGYVTAGGWK